VRLSILAVAALAAAPAFAAGSVEVAFKAAHGWADAGRSGVEIERTQARIGQILKAQAARLPEGQALAITVTDIDLAGTLRPVRNGQEVRVVNGRADAPRIALHYVLRAGAKVLREADETVTELNYFSTLEPRAAREPLPYETQMLERWFAQRFANPQ
jgi:hypothetical protein